MMRIAKLPFFNSFNRTILFKQNRFTQPFITRGQINSIGSYQFASRPNENPEKTDHFSDCIKDVHKETIYRENSAELDEKQRTFLQEQIEQKQRFEEVFNIIMEKQPEQSRLLRLYIIYKRKYKRYGLHFKSFVILNLVLAIAIIIIPGKDFPVQKQIQMRFVNALTDLAILLQSEKYQIISAKSYVDFIFNALKYMERNDIHDVDYMVRVFHKLSLIIYETSEAEKKKCNDPDKQNTSQMEGISSKNNGLDGNLSIDRDKKSLLGESPGSLRKSETLNLILGSMQNMQSVLTELIHLRPSTFLEKDFQEVLVDYLEIASMHAEDLYALRMYFFDDAKGNENKQSNKDLVSIRTTHKYQSISNVEDYTYFVKNQLNFIELAGILLTYCPDDKQIVYECVHRFLDTNHHESVSFHAHFVKNFRMQLYNDIAAKRVQNTIHNNTMNSSSTQQNDTNNNRIDKKLENPQTSNLSEIQKLSMQLVTKLFRIPECSSILVQDKLLSNMVKLFIVKNENMYLDKLKEIVGCIAQNKEIILLRESPAFKIEFDELNRVASINKQAKQLLTPLLSI